MKDIFQGEMQFIRGISTVAHSATAPRNNEEMSAYVLCSKAGGVEKLGMYQVPSQPKTWKMVRGLTLVLTSYCWFHWILPRLLGWSARCQPGERREQLQGILTEEHKVVYF
jgi:hypothetical protein